MTDAELRDEAVAELEATTISYPTWRKRVAEGYRGKPYDGSKTAWGRAFEKLGLIGGVTPPPPPPPTGGKLQWRPPPGYNGGDPREHSSFPGYEYIEITGPGTVQMQSGKDYFLKLKPGGVKWLTAPGEGRKEIRLMGGRHRVIVGGSILGESRSTSGSSSDPIGIYVGPGDADGITHLEGLDIDTVNGITMETNQIVQRQACHIRAHAYQHNHGSAHPDTSQVWGGGQPGQGPVKAIRDHYLTCYTTYTGETCLVLSGPDPLSWWRRKVDIHPYRREDGTKQAGHFTYMASGATSPGTTGYCVYDGREVYCELPQGGGGAYTRPLDGIVIYRAGGTPATAYWPYEFHAPDGTLLYTSPLQPSGGNAPTAISMRPGNYLTYGRIPAFAGMRWTIGLPPDSLGAVNGEFQPLAVTGENYIPRGYA
jgi:hypothetical protein